MTPLRKTGYVALKMGFNEVEMPACPQTLGLDCHGHWIHLVYDSPAELLGVTKMHYYVVPVGDMFEADCDRYTVIGVANFPDKRAAVVYQTWKFPEQTSGLS